ALTSYTLPTRRSHERRSLLAEPFLESGVLLELRHLDTVDGWPLVPQLPYVLFAHLADPKHSVPLQAGMGEIDGAFIQRLVEVTASDQYQVRDVPGEFQQQTLGGVVLPCAQPSVGEPDAVAIPETELNRSGLVLYSP